MFAGHPDPLVRGTDPDPSIIKQNIGKTFISTVLLLWHLADFLNLKNDVNVSSKSNNNKKLLKKIIFCWCLEGHWWKEQDSDPLVRGAYLDLYGTGTKMSQIRNTEKGVYF